MKEIKKTALNFDELNEAYESFVESLASKLNFFTTSEEDDPIPNPNALKAAQGLKDIYTQPTNPDSLNTAIGNFWTTWNLTTLFGVNQPSSLLDAKNSLSICNDTLQVHITDINRLKNAYIAALEGATMKKNFPAEILEKAETKLQNLEVSLLQLALVQSEIKDLRQYLHSPEMSEALSATVSPKNQNTANTAEEKKPTSTNNRESKENTPVSNLPQQLTESYFQAIASKSSLSHFSVDEEEQPRPGQQALNAAEDLRGIYQKAAIEVAAGDKGMLRSSLQDLQSFNDNKNSFWPQLQTFWTTWNLTQLSGGIQMPSSLEDAREQDSLNKCNTLLQEKIASIDALLPQYDQYINGLDTTNNYLLIMEATNQKGDLESLKTQLDIVQKQVASVVNYPRNFDKASRVFNEVDRNEQLRAHQKQEMLRKAREAEAAEAAAVKMETPAVAVVEVSQSSRSEGAPTETTAREIADKVKAESDRQQNLRFQAKQDERDKQNSSPKVSSPLFWSTLLTTAVLSSGSVFLLTWEAIFEASLLSFTLSAGAIAGIAIAGAAVIAIITGIAMALVMRSNLSPKTKQTLLGIGMVVFGLAAIAAIVFSSPFGVLSLLAAASISFTNLVPLISLVVAFILTMPLLVTSYRTLAEKTVVSALGRAAHMAIQTPAPASSGPVTVVAQQAAPHVASDKDITATLLAASTNSNPTENEHQTFINKGLDRLSEISPQLYADPKNIAAIKKAGLYAQEISSCIVLLNRLKALTDENRTTLAAAGKNVIGIHQGLEHYFKTKSILEEKASSPALLEENRENVTAILKAGKKASGCAMHVANCILLLEQNNLVTAPIRDGLVVNVYEADTILKALEAVQRSSPGSFTVENATVIVNAGKDATAVAQRFCPDPKVEEVTGTLFGNNGRSI